MIGGVGERKTLRTVARYADMWNAFGDDELLRHKAKVLRQRCAELGRDPATIRFSVACKPVVRDTRALAEQALERIMAANRVPMADVVDDHSFWIGDPESLAQRMLTLHTAGFDTFIGEMAAPFDPETLERWINEVKPMVEAG
jgi:alkanesulfonate monooxygenase SsuD/methylene tetrahydromethanopterin reductase-like flavin-dependent oxidoreductase (luciferase family)